MYMYFAFWLGTQFLFIGCSCENFSVSTSILWLIAEHVEAIVD